MPADLPPGLHHVVLTGLTSGRSVTIPLSVTAGAAATTSAAPTSGSLPFTGLDVTGLVGGGLVLLLAGSLLRIASRRRSVP